MHSTTAPSMGSVSAAVDVLVAAPSGAGVRDLSHAELTELVAHVRRQQARLESVALAVGEVDGRGSHVHEGGLTTGAWVRRHTRSTPAEATATVRTARTLRSGALPATTAALSRGDISARHAQVIASGALDAPAGAVALIEPEALAVAREADVRAVAGIMRRFAHALDAEDADRAAVRRYERRGFTLAPTLDGSLAISGLADEASGSVIATAVDTASPPVTGDRRTPAQRRLDGLTEICARFLASPDTPRHGGGGHPHVIVTTDAATLAGPAPSDTDGTDGTDGSGGSGGGLGPGPGSPGATLSWVGHITGSTARRLACDAQLTTIGIGPDGEVTDTATERRYFTPAQRRAMIARDGDRCLWPWCDRPIAWADGHHLQWRSRGGPTTVANLVHP